MNISGLAQDIMGQAKWVFWLIVVFTMIPLAWRKAWIGAVMAALGLAFIGIFVIYPTQLQGVATWMKGLLSI